MTVQELIDQLSAVPRYYDVDLPVTADQAPEVNETKARVLSSRCRVSLPFEIIFPEAEAEDDREEDGYRRGLRGVLGQIAILTKARKGKRKTIADADAAEILRELQAWVEKELDWGE